ncbi:MAG: DUF502 domain-containing protein [Candidatus Pacebacteria bacterium]|jgi:uncharacterized membrane protein|nr:DUF502 domain-containing protein [Candidatus Paceibacterota bacterium]|tara:strand:- start:457 stop:1062 length:606 start_codon:yes stop_codon:yes gene_type:complete
MKKFRTIIVAGLLVWVPLGATIFVLRLLISLFGNLDSWLSDQLNIPIAGIGILLALLVLLGTGLIAANYFGKRFVSFWESLLERIPLVRNIYSAVKRFAEIVLSDSSQSFSKVLLIEYPRKGLYSLSFQTSQDLGEVQGKTGEDLVCVFVPTTPNPTSGLILMVPKQDVIELDMGVEDALKMVISLGVVVPGEGTVNQNIE